MFSCFIQMENKNLCNAKNKYIDAKIVFVRKRKSSEYMAILSTDVHACDADIVKAYAYRWDIEVFFKTSKQFLRLDKGTESCNFDALIASITISCVRYCFLSYVERRQEEPMTLGDLYRACCDELPEITFEQAFAQVLGITAQALALAFQAGPDGARDLLNQLKNLVFSLKYDKLEKVYKQEAARLAA